MILFRREDGRLHIAGHVDAATIDPFDGSRRRSSAAHHPRHERGRLHRLLRAERALEASRLWVPIVRSGSRPSNRCAESSTSLASMRFRISSSCSLLEEPARPGRRWKDKTLAPPTVGVERRSRGVQNGRSVGAGGRPAPRRECRARRQGAWALRRFSGPRIPGCSLHPVALPVEGNGEHHAGTDE